MDEHFRHARLSVTSRKCYPRRSGTSNLIPDEKTTVPNWNTWARRKYGTSNWVVFKQIMLETDIASMRGSACSGYSWLVFFSSLSFWRCKFKVMRRYLKLSCIGHMIGLDLKNCRLMVGNKTLWVCSVHVEDYETNATCIQRRSLVYHLLLLSFAPIIPPRMRKNV